MNSDSEISVQSERNHLNGQEAYQVALRSFSAIEKTLTFVDGYKYRRTESGTGRVATRGI